MPQWILSFFVVALAILCASVLVLCACEREQQRKQERRGQQPASR